MNKETDEKWLLEDISQRSIAIESLRDAFKRYPSDHGLIIELIDKIHMYNVSIKSLLKILNKNPKW